MEVTRQRLNMEEEEDQKVLDTDQKKINLKR